MARVEYASTPALARAIDVQLRPPQPAHASVTVRTSAMTERATPTHTRTKCRRGIFMLQLQLQLQWRVSDLPIDLDRVGDARRILPGHGHERPEGEAADEHHEDAD